MHQLIVTLALGDRVQPATIASVVEGDLALMTDEVRLGVRFARAVLDHDAVADELRHEVVERWGTRALVSLGFGSRWRGSTRR